MLVTDTFTSYFVNSHKAKHSTSLKYCVCVSVILCIDAVVISYNPTTETLLSKKHALQLDM